MDWERVLKKFLTEPLCYRPFRWGSRSFARGLLRERTNLPNHPPGAADREATLRAWTSAWGNNVAGWASNRRTETAGSERGIKRGLGKADMTPEELVTTLPNDYYTTRTRRRLHSPDQESPDIRRSSIKTWPYACGERVFRSLSRAKSPTGLVVNQTGRHTGLSQHAPR
jgi:hypothetical protein